MSAREGRRRSRAVGNLSQINNVVIMSQRVTSERCCIPKGGYAAAPLSVHNLHGDRGHGAVAREGTRTEMAEEEERETKTRNRG